MTKFDLCDYIICKYEGEITHMNRQSFEIY